jgi:hypothetical protein
MVYDLGPTATHVKTHKFQICSQAVDKLCSHCSFLLVVTSLEQAVNNLSLMALSDLLQSCYNKFDTVMI